MCGVGDEGGCRHAQVGQACGGKNIACHAIFLNQRETNYLYEIQATFSFYFIQWIQKSQLVAAVPK